MALPALGAVLGVVNTAGTVASVGTGIGGMIQSSNQAEEQAKLQRQQMTMEKMNQEKLSESLDKLADAAKKNPQAAAQAGAMVGQAQQAAYSEVPHKFKRGRQKLFALPKFLYDPENSPKNFKEVGQQLTHEATEWDTDWKGNKVGAMGKAMKVGGAAMSVHGAISGAMANKAAKEAHADTIAGMKATMAESNNRTNDLVTNINNITNSIEQKTMSDSRVNLFSNHVDKAKQKQFGWMENSVDAIKKHWGTAKEALKKNSAVQKVINTNAYKNGRALVGSVGEFAGNYKGVLIGGLASGAGMGIYDYVGNKYIQHDLKKEGIDMNTLSNYKKQQMAAEQQMQQDAQMGQYNPQQFNAQVQRTYADTTADTVANTVVKDAKPFINPNNPTFTGTMAERLGKGAKYYAKEGLVSVPALAFGAGLGTGMKIWGYHGDKQALKAMMQEAQAAGMTPANAQNALAKGKPTVAVGAVPQGYYNPQPQQVAQRQYSIFRPIGNFVRDLPTKIGGLGDTISRNWQKWKAAPVQRTLHGLSKHMAQGGGIEGVNEFANHLMKSNNQFVQNTGKFMKNHQNLALAGSIAVGAGITGKAWELGQKAVEKVGRTVDRDAYAYDDFQNQTIQ